MNAIVDSLFLALTSLINGVPSAADLISQVETTVNDAVDKLQGAVSGLLDTVDGVLTVVGV